MTESEQKTAVDIEQNWKNIQDGFGAIAPALPVLVATDKPIKLETITTEDRLRGAMLDAANMLASGHVTMAWQTLLDALRL